MYNPISKAFIKILVVSFSPHKGKGDRRKGKGVFKVSSRNLGWFPVEIEVDNFLAQICNYNFEIPDFGKSLLSIMR